MSDIDKDDELSALLGGLAQPEPSAELDAAILAQAEQALAPVAANDPDYPNPRRDFLVRHRVPLSLAATVLIAANLVLLAPEERPAARQEMVNAEIPMEVVAVPPSAAAPPVEVEAPVVMAAEASPGRASDAAPKPVIPEAPAPTAAAQAAPEQAPAAAAAPPAPPAAAPVLPVAAATGAMVATPAADARPAMAPAVDAPPAMASAPAVDARGEMEAMAATEARRAMKSMPAAKPGVGMPPHPPPALNMHAPPPKLARSLVAQADEELEQIVAMEKYASPAAVAKAWKDFRRRHPDYPVDPAVRARLDALPLPAGD